MDAANFLLSLNGGKILPFPMVHRGRWEPGMPGAWRSFQWSEEQIKELLLKIFALFLEATRDAFDYGFIIAQDPHPGPAIKKLRKIMGDDSNSSANA